MKSKTSVKSVAVVGAGASGAAAAAALASEGCFERIRVFERRENAGGTWLYDADPGPLLQPRPGALPSELDPPLQLPDHFPIETIPSLQQRYLETPVYADLTTNVPSIAMSFSDHKYPYGPFVPHWIPRIHIQDYFSIHRTDTMLSLNTTVEDITRTSAARSCQWRLTLRQHDASKGVDRWWQEVYDAVVLANGHYSIPTIPKVDGLEEFMLKFPGKVFHSKSYRSPQTFSNQTVLVVGNSASGHDIVNGLVQTAKLPVLNSIRSKSRWDGPNPPDGVQWRPVIERFTEDGNVVFADGSVIHPDELDHIIYCTGYKVSFPFWNESRNGGRLWDLHANRLHGNYLHVFFRDYPTLFIIGMPRTLTFRSFEYQAIAVARILSGRNASNLPDYQGMLDWELARDDLVRTEHRKFHDIPWDNNETMDYFQRLYEIAGLPQLDGSGKCPPVLDSQTRWAVKHIKKYPEPERGQEDESWELVNRNPTKDSLHFI